MYKIIFYRDQNGRSEVEEYIRNLRLKQSNKDARTKLKKITAYLELLSKKGLNITIPYIKHLAGEIWELRPLRDRILFARWYNDKFILLNHFTKQTQKTPRREIEKANRLLNNYKGRINKNG